LRFFTFVFEQLRHFSPQAFRFFMEQHVENVLSLYTQRQQRRAQLETEMNQCQLAPAVQAQIRRMLAQKESNYLRLRRAKMDRLLLHTLALLQLTLLLLPLHRHRSDECSLRKSPIIYDSDALRWTGLHYYHSHCIATLQHYSYYYYYICKKLTSLQLCVRTM